jgi:hypothetical protein
MPEEKVTELEYLYYNLLGLWLKAAGAPVFYNPKNDIPHFKTGTLYF